MLHAGSVTRRRPAVSRCPVVPLTSSGCWRQRQYSTPRGGRADGQAGRRLQVAGPRRPRGIHQGPFAILSRRSRFAHEICGHAATARTGLRGRGRWGSEAMPDESFPDTHDAAQRDKQMVALTSVAAAVVLTGLKLVVGLLTGRLGLLAGA